MPFVTTDDGARLHWQEAGSGSPILDGRLPSRLFLGRTLPTPTSPCYPAPDT